MPFAGCNKAIFALAASLFVSKLARASELACDLGTQDSEPSTSSALDKQGSQSTAFWMHSTVTGPSKLQAGTGFDSKMPNTILCLAHVEAKRISVSFSVRAIGCSFSKAMPVSNGRDALQETQALWRRLVLHQPCTCCFFPCTSACSLQ